MFHSGEYTRGDSNGQVELKVKALFYHILEKSRGDHVKVLFLPVFPQKETVIISVIMGG